METLSSNAMNLTQFALFFIGVFGLFIWNRTESRNDIRHMDAKLDANRELLREIHNDNKEAIHSIHLEMKDFHNRLCSIEERNRK